MLSVTEALKLKTKESLLAELREHVKVRNMMGGALYWNVLDEECFQIAAKCVFLGCDKKEISKLLRD
jgi:hypothetical protein